MLGLKCNLVKKDRLERRIVVSSHKSSESLKSEIRKTIRYHANHGMRLTTMFAHGAFIYLRFEAKRLNNNLSPFIMANNCVRQ
jgi:hypothetical protein